MSKRKCEVIEVYPEEHKMAVRMLNGRVECVQRQKSEYRVGTKGWAVFGRTMQGYGWSFEPFKTKGSPKCE